MVAPIVAAAAPAVISSATEDDGLLNKLFKIAMLLGILALGAISIIIVSLVINIGDVVGATFNLVGLAFDFIIPGSSRIGAIATVAAYFVNAFGFGGRN